MSHPDDKEDIYTTIINSLVQTTGLAAAVIFGIFSVLSWEDAQVAKVQAETANTLALAAICAQVSSQGTAQNIALQGLCDSFLVGAVPALNAAASTLLPNVPIVTTIPSSSITFSFPSSNFQPFSSFYYSSSSVGFSGGVSHSVPTGHSKPGSSIGAPSLPAPGASSTRGHNHGHSPRPSASPTALTPLPTSGSAPGLPAPAMSSTTRNIAIGVGIGLGLPLLVIGPLTVCRRRQRTGRNLWTGHLPLINKSIDS